MSDLGAGTEVLALDFPPAVWASDSTAINNPTNTAYAAGTPEVGTTFMAPTSGRVLLGVGGGIGNSATADRIFLAPQVFQGTSAAGTEVLSPTTVGRGLSSENASSGFHYGSRETVLTGLTPGTTYYVRVMHAVATDAGAQTADIACRQVLVAPLS